MDLIIDFDGIQDSSKQDWLLRTLKLMGIGYHTAEKPQTIDEYNDDLESGNAEIEKGNFVTNDQLKKEIKKRCAITLKDDDAHILELWKVGAIDDLRCEVTSLLSAKGLYTC